ncbi:MAG TPA: DUF4177 domain-containing protein [Anaerolineales bacterium]|nr:DUF4177 domain-containing protein [Anaerolineales bacterium]
MQPKTLWEYRVLTFGSALSGVKDEELEALLDSWGEEGWEVFEISPITNSSKIRIAARRPLSSSTRRQRSWPSE